MKRLNVTPRALRELEGIADFTLERWGEAKAEAYIADLWRRLYWIAENPLLGRSRFDVSSDLRSFKQGSHLIFYLVGETEIKILGVPHASADFTSYFDD